MLIHWQSHQEYLTFLHETKVHPDSSQRTRLLLEFGPVRKKLRLLNLDPVMEYLSAFYSPVGRPAKNQTQIIRSLILMVMLGFTSLTAWLLKLKADSLRAALVGSPQDSLPPPGSYFDFMDRIWTQSKTSQQTGRKDLFPKDKNGKPSNKPGKGKKLPNKHSGITDKMAAYALNHIEFPFHYEKRLRQVFRLAAILPSLKDGLIPEKASPFPATAPASIPMPPLMGIRSVTAWKKVSRAVPVTAISPILMPTGDGTATRMSFILDTPFTCSAPTMQNLVLTCPCISVSWMPDATTVSALSFPFGNSKPLTRISLSGTSAWTPPMITTPLTDSARNGRSALLLTLIPTGDARIPSRTPSPLIQTEPRCAWLVSAWSTGGTAGRNIPTNGAARWSAAKWIPAPVRKNVLPLLTVAVSTQNRTGISVSIPLSHGERRNIRKSTITVLPAKG